MYCSHIYTDKPSVVDSILQVVPTLHTSIVHQCIKHPVVY